MSNIINEIIQTALEWVISAVNTIISFAIGGMGLDNENTLDTFFYVFPFCKQVYEVFVVTGLFILFTTTIFQLFKALFGPLTEAESPGWLLLRTGFFTFLVCAAADICGILVSCGTAVYQEIDALPMKIETRALVPEDLIKYGLQGLAIGGTALLTSGMLVMVFVIIIFVRIFTNLFNLILECIERYIILGFLTIVAPLCFATGASKATNNIFRSFIKMYISQLVVMCLSLLFLKVFSQSVGQFIYNLPDAHAKAGPFLSLLMLLAWLKLGQRVDQHMSALGLSVAQAGGLGQEMAFAAAAAADGRGISGKLANAGVNALHGTTFGKNGSPKSVLDALSQGMLGKKAARMQAANPDPNGPKTTSRLSQDLAKRANQAGAPMSISDMQKNINGASGGAQGAFIGNSMKKELGLPDEWQATGACRMDKDGNMIGKFKDENGDEHTFSMKQGEDPNAIATMQGKNGATYSIMSADQNGTVDALTGGDLTPSNMDMQAAAGDITAVNDKDGNTIEGAAGVVQTDDGIAAINEDGEIMKDDDGNAILAGSVETDDGRTIDMDDGTVVSDDGQIYKQDEDGDIAMVSGKDGFIEDDKGEYGALNDGETALTADDEGEYALAEAGSKMYEPIDGHTGDMFYDEASGGFKNSGDYFDEDGKAKEENVKSKKDGEVTFKDGTKALIDDIGKLQNSYNSLAVTSEDYGKGMELKKDANGDVVSYDARGNEDKNGSFVKTADNKMINKDNIVKNGQGEIQSFAQKNIGQESGGTGFSQLQTDSAGKIATFNSSGQIDPNGQFVKTASGQLMAKSSFALGDTGNVQGFENRKESLSGTMEKLHTNSDGSFKTYNSSGVEDKNGGFYKRANADGTSSLVSISGYGMNGKGETASYSASSTGLSAGAFVKDQDTGEYMQINRAGIAAGAAPQTMNAQGEADANGSYVSAINSKGQQVLAHATTAPNGSVQTYNMKPQTATISTIDGSAPTISTVGYSSNGSSINTASIQSHEDGSNSSGYYCKSDSGAKYNEISTNGGFTDTGAIQTYDRHEDGSYTPNTEGTGAFAKTVNPGNAYEENYSKIGGTDIYTPNQVTEAGLPVTGTSADGAPQVTLDSSNFQVHSSSNGVVQATIGGNECTLYNERMGYEPVSTQAGECAKMSINGESYYVQTHTPGNFTTNPSYEKSQTYSGDEAQRIMTEHGITDRIVTTHGDRTVSEAKYDTVQTTNQGMICYNSSSPRIEKTDDKGNTYWSQEASYITPYKPSDESKYETLKDPTTGNETYKMNVEARFSKPQGGKGKMAVTRQIYDKNAHNKRSKTKFRNTKLGRFGRNGR